jgi:predicted Rossmann-fold nucleotide-binding protein
MRIAFIRWLSFLLIACLLADSSRATIQVASPSPIPSVFPSTFQREALAVRSLGTLHDWGSFLTPRKLLAAAGITVVAIAIGKAATKGIPLTRGTTLMMFLPFVAAILGYHREAEHPTLHRIIDERSEIVNFHKKLGRAVVTFGSARILSPADPVYQLGEELGRELYRAGLVPRTGAGPSTMEAVLKGYVEARTAKGESRTDQNAAQGIKIVLEWESDVNPFVEIYLQCQHFVTRKLGLHNNTYGAIALPGGFGTLDEIFEVWQRGRPLVLLEPEFGPYAHFWTEIIQGFRDAREKAGLTTPLPIEPFITNSPRKAVEYIQKAPPKLWKSNPISIHEANKELRRGYIELERNGKAVVMIGRPAAGSEELNFAQKLIARLIITEQHIRIGTRGTLLNTALQVGRALKGSKLLSAVLFVRPKGTLRLEDRRFPKKIITHDRPVQQVLVSKRPQGFMFFPGSVGTMNRLFDILQLMQTHKMVRHPMILVGTDFWKEFLGPIYRLMLLKVPVMDESTHTQKINPDTGEPVYYSMISPGDEKILQLAESPDHAYELINRPPPEAPLRGFFFPILSPDLSWYEAVAATLALWLAMKGWSLYGGRIKDAARELLRAA